MVSEHQPARLALRSAALPRPSGAGVQDLLNRGAGAAVSTDCQGLQRQPDGPANLHHKRRWTAGALDNVRWTVVPEAWIDCVLLSVAQARGQDGSRRAVSPGGHGGSRAWPAQHMHQPSGPRWDRRRVEHQAVLAPAQHGRSWDGVNGKTVLRSCWGATKGVVPRKTAAHQRRAPPRTPRPRPPAPSLRACAPSAHTSPPYPSPPSPTISSLASRWTGPIQHRPS
jgi:hypothetical protein